MEERISPRGNPRSIGKVLTGPLIGFWCYRVGNYRIICDIQNDTLCVLVVEIGHGREVYRRSTGEPYGPRRPVAIRARLDKKSRISCDSGPYRSISGFQPRPLLVLAVNKCKYLFISCRVIVQCTVT